MFVGGKDRCGSVIFLLDTVDLRWSSVDVANSGGIRGRCLLHGAVSISGLEAHRYITIHHKAPFDRAVR